MNAYRPNRRQLLKALGFGALSGLVSRGPAARADAPPAAPSRIVFYVQPHGHIPNAWNMDVGGPTPTNEVATRSLVNLAPTDLSPTLRPLYPFRDRILAVEGLSHTSVLADIAQVAKTGGDMNNHQVGVAHLLSGSRAMQIPGTYCTGGARTLDQELARRLAAPGRFDSRVYGFDYIPNSVVSPFSFLDAGKASPIVSDPRAAFTDLLGYATPPAPPTTREDRIRALRPSVLDAVSQEYAALAPTLGGEAKRKLEAHRDLVRELEASLGAVSRGAACSLGALDTTAQIVRQFMRVTRLALACDLTRVVTFTAPVPLCPELGYPAEATFHAYAHQSINGSTSCGQMFNPVAAEAMTALDAWHAAHVAFLLSELDSVPEGDGTLLDHTVVVWVTELATPTHQHHDVLTLLAGGCNGFFGTGRYVRYPRILPNPLDGMPMTGPGHNRLHVSLLQAMGKSAGWTDDSFGMTDATGADGTPISLRGPLTELHA